MVKRYFTIVNALLFATIIAKAGLVTPEQALASAKQALASTKYTRANGNQALKLAYTQTASKRIQGSNSYPLYYAFDRGNENGFVIVAGDDKMKPILGICDNGHFDANTPVPGMRWWLDAIAVSVQRIAESETTDIDNSEEQTKAVAPLIQTRWNQKEPYNYSCPIDTFKVCKGDNAKDTISATGCVATALAQICYYWQYPKQVAGIVSYQDNVKKHEGKNIKYEFNLADYPFDYAEMRTGYNTDYTKEETKSIANLLLVCGAAMQMNYCKESSGSNINRSVLTETFGYDKSCHSISRNFFTPREWSRTLTAELQAGRPILYSANSDYYGGHEFICDGIDEEGRFHFNWGWGGQDNGYFDITTLDPSTMQTYVGNQVATIGILPDQGGESLHISNDINYSALNVSVERNHINHQSYLMASLTRLSALETSVNAKIGYILYDSNGNIVKKDVNNNNISLKASQYYTDEYPFAYITLDKSFEDGTYYLVPAYGESIEDLQAITGGSKMTYKDYIVVTVKDGSISAKLAKTLNAKDINLSISKNLTAMDGTNTFYVGSQNTSTIEITNNGEAFDGYIEIATKARTAINIGKGETQTVVLRLTPDEGDYTLDVLAYQDEADEKVKIGEVSYTGKPTTPGTPIISVEDVEILTPEVAINDVLKFNATINNTGGYFYGKLSYIIYPSEYSKGSLYYHYTDAIEIDQERKTLTFSVPVNTNFDLYGVSSGKGYLVLNQDFSHPYEFTVIGDATGISSITTTAKRRKAMIYNINGTPCGYDLETLPKGIYIQNGKKIVK